MDAKEVGVFHAKTHLSELLDLVERGQVIYLTRRGRRVAELRPIQPAKRPLSRGSAKNPRYRMDADFDATPPDFAEYER
jgi:prevent-host-death family protein